MPLLWCVVYSVVALDSFVFDFWVWCLRIVLVLCLCLFTEALVLFLVLGGLI